MNTNPARHLYEGMARMMEAGGSVQARYQAIAQDGETYSSAFLRMVDYYRETASLLDQAGRYKSKAPIMDRTWNALLMPQAPWSTTTPTFEEMDLVALEGVADALEHVPSLPAAMSQDHLEGVRVALEKMKEVLDNHPEIPDHLAAHLRYLITRGINVLDGETIDVFALRSISFEAAAVGSTITEVLISDDGEDVPEDILEFRRTTTNGLILPWLLAATAGAGGDLLTKALDKLPEVTKLIEGLSSGM